MATTPKPTVPAAKAGTGTPSAGGNPQPPVTTPADDFKDGSKLRDGTSTTGKKYKEYKADVTEGQTVQQPDDIEIPAKSAAIFDEQGMDPYEVYTAEYGVTK